MSRTAINLIVDLSATALFLGMSATGFVLAFVMPPGTNRTLILWGLTRHQWGSVHLCISFALLAVILLHVCLHWQWLVATIGKRLGLTSTRRSLLRSLLPAVLVLAAVVSLFAWLTLSSVQEITDASRAGVCPTDTPVRQQSSPDISTEKQRPVVTFWEDVYPVLQRACLSCHGPSRQAAHFRIDRREDYFGRDGRTAQVVPGDSTRSPLIAIVSGQRRDMAKADVHRLPDTDVALLRAWIDSGAEWAEKGAKQVKLPR
jgi:hypothetical protein